MKEEKDIYSPHYSSIEKEVIRDYESYNISLAEFCLVLNYLKQLDLRWQDPEWDERMRAAVTHKDLKHLWRFY